MMFLVSWFSSGFTEILELFYITEPLDIDDPTEADLSPFSYVLPFVYEASVLLSEEYPCFNFDDPISSFF